MRIIMIGFLALFITGASVAADLYRWVDKNGVVNYGDQAPDDTVKKLQLRKLEPNVIDGQPSYALQQAVSKHPVILFGGDCGPLCVNAQALLDKRGVPYTLKDPQKNKADAEALNTLMGGGEMQLPVLKVGNNPIKGFETAHWNTALDEAGYPKSPLPGSVKKGLTTPASK